MGTPVTTIPMGEAFTYQAARDPDRAAIVCWDGSITRGELESRANRSARHFAALGVVPGDLVTIALPNSIEFYVAVAASWKLGAIPQPLSYRLPDIERNAIIELANPALVVGVDPERVAGRPALAAEWQPDPQVDEQRSERSRRRGWRSLLAAAPAGRR